MSILSALPKPLKLVLKPGTYQSGDTRGGLNINNWMKNFLKRIGFAVTTDCCNYFPSFPLLGTDFDLESEVPNGGVYFADATTIKFRGFDGTIYTITST